tara:strand:- start:470 stop:985 length:516 start_codon:yes stop_codon:yes gene_type:complete
MKEVAMKSLAQYLAESEKSYKFRLRSINEISDEHMDRIESHMKKYNMESMSACKKTIMQPKPRGFDDVGPNEVYICDMELKLPATPNALQEEICRICGCPVGSIIINNMNESEELWNDELKDEDEEPKSVLADADYSEAEKVDHSEHYGNDFIDKFVKDQPTGELNKEYKV